VSRAGESAAAKVLLEGGVAEHRAADAASTADLSAVRIEDLTAESWRRQLTEGLDAGERPGAYYEGHFGPLPVCHSANKTRVIHRGQSYPWHDRQMSKAAGEVA
jgi:hypothetical protein